MTLEAHTHFLNVETPEGPRRIAWECWHAHGMEQAPVLICVHGLTRNRHDFDLIAKAMSDHYRVVTVDILGRGDSDRLAAPEHYGYPLYISQMLQLLKHIAEATGEQRFDWLGTSMGGLIGMMIAASPGSPIERLIMNDIGPFIPLKGLTRLSDYVGRDPAFSTMAEVEEYLRLILSGFGRLTEEQWQHMARYSVATGADGYLRLRYDPAIASAFEGLSEDVDLWAVWDAVSCPVLVLQGEESDLLDSGTVARMCEKPSVISRAFAQCGHAPALMSDDQIQCVRDFLVM